MRNEEFTLLRTLRPVDDWLQDLSLTLSGGVHLRLVPQKRPRGSILIQKARPLKWCQKAYGCLASDGLRFSISANISPQRNNISRASAMWAGSAPIFVLALMFYSW